MAGKFSKATAPGTGYTDAVTQSSPPTHPPAGLSAEGAGGAENAGSVSNEAHGEPVQGG
jgi:hypothetical protein